MGVPAIAVIWHAVGFYEPGNCSCCVYVCAVSGLDGYWASTVTLLADVESFLVGMCHVGYGIALIRVVRNIVKTVIIVDGGDEDVEYRAATPSRKEYVIS